MQPRGESAPSRPAADGVDARASGDREEPGAPGGLGAEVRQRPPRAKERVLGDVVGLAHPDEVRCEPPDLRLAEADGGAEGDAVNVASLDQERRQPVHRRKILGNSGAREVDYLSMKCHTIRAAISARLDGEDPGVEAAALDEHMLQCAACRAFAHDAEVMHRDSRLARAPAVPDLTAPILKAIGSDRPHRHATHERALRFTLVGVALIMIVAALPALVLGDDAGLPVHAARHVGSFDLALAIGFLFAAWRPSRIAGLLPVVAALVACLVATSILDVIDGRTGALTESQHIVEVAGLAAAWLLAHPLAPRRRARLSTS
jgi:predicted anti-sigma-YlaC factor YlaD